MTNEELKQIFETIEAEAENIFDIYDALTKFEEAYQEMSIAKIKPTIYDAYDTYCKHQPVWEKVLNKILTADYANIVEQFDLSKLVEQIPEQYKSLLGDLIDEQKNQNKF